MAESTDQPLDFITPKEDEAPNPNESLLQPHLPEAIPDDLFYFEDAVDSYLFRVPREYLIQESPVFRTMFELPPGENTPVEGKSADHPIRLEGITRDEFRQLLRVVFPRQGHWKAQETLTIQEWTSVLKLTTMWDMQGLRAYAIKRLQLLIEPYPVTQVVLSNTYHVVPWLLPALNRLVQREAPMGMKEVTKLGVEYVLKIAAAREMVLPRGDSVRRARGATTSDYQNILSDLFSSKPV